MKEDIIYKLRDTLVSQIDSECKVVYLLCEARKLLDKYPPDPMQPALKLYCHWALHVDLDHAGTTLSLLKRIDEFVGSVYGGEPRDDAAEQRMLQELHIFTTFREELGQFLAVYGLPTDVCEDNAQWRQFLRHYSGVIEDGTLSCRAKKVNFKYVKEVVFRMDRASHRPEGVETFLPFDFTWTVVLLDDQKQLSVTTNARMLVPGQWGMDSAISLY